MDKREWEKRGVVMPRADASVSEMPAGFICISFCTPIRGIASMQPIPVYSAAGYRHQAISGVNVHSTYMSIADFMRQASIAANVACALTAPSRWARRTPVWTVDVNVLIDPRADDDAEAKESP